MASTTFVDNSSIIYASWLNDVNSAVYNGTFISSTITPTNIVCNGSVSGTGFSGLVNNTLTSPGAIGNGTPNTGAFTTLTLTNALGVSYGGTGTTTSTGSGATVRATSPALVTPDLGTPSAIVLTNATGTSNSLNAGIGVNQTWQDMTGSRALSTKYTNSTGKPIIVNVYVSAGAVSLSQLQASINGGTNIVISLNTNSGGGVGAAGHVLIPTGATYAISNPYTSTLAQWFELR